MIIIVLMFFIFAIVGTIWYSIDFWFDGEAILIGIANGMIGVLVGLFVWLIGCAVITPTEPVVTDTLPIYAMSDTMGVEGSFFLGCGDVDSEMKYVYAEETDKGIKIKTLDADNAYIKYINEGEEPYIEKIEYHHKSGFVEWLFTPYILHNETFIYVPEGTVKNVYNVDLE